MLTWISKCGWSKGDACHTSACHLVNSEAIMASRKVKCHREVVGLICSSQVLLIEAGFRVVSLHNENVFQDGDATRSWYIDIPYEEHVREKCLLVGHFVQSLLESNAIQPAKAFAHLPPALDALYHQLAKTIIAFVPCWKAVHNHCQKWYFLNRCSGVVSTCRHRKKHLLALSDLAALFHLKHLSLLTFPDNTFLQHWSWHYLGI